jgi:hypothetical protein
MGFGLRPIMASAAAKDGNWIIVAPLVLHHVWSEVARDEGLERFWLTTPQQIQRRGLDVPGSNAIIEFSPNGKKTLAALRKTFGSFDRIWIRPSYVSGAGPLISTFGQRLFTTLKVEP